VILFVVVPGFSPAVFGAAAIATFRRVGDIAPSNRSSLIPTTHNRPRALQPRAHRIIPDINRNILEIFRLSQNVFEIPRLPEPLSALPSISIPVFLLEKRDEFQ